MHGCSLCMSHAFADGLGKKEWALKIGRHHFLVILDSRFEKVQPHARRYAGIVDKQVDLPENGIGLFDNGLAIGCAGDTSLAIGYFGTQFAQLVERFGSARFVADAIDGQVISFLGKGFGNAKPMPRLPPVINAVFFIVPARQPIGVFPSFRGLFRRAARRAHPL